MEPLPEIAVYDHFGFDSDKVAKLQAFAERAIVQALRFSPAAGSVKSPLQEALEVEVSLVSDQKIADVHVEFMGIEGATDVITFHHGEILVSVETARCRAGEFGHSDEKELALYIAHGLIHLHGYDDHTPEEAETMRLLQEQVLSECWVD
ncbi:MAG: rRNA maturation RNase YbeY [Verrucomicrobiales bacterium]|nr:rRNA maturation RNase YbeY [Verrucomicrobiae bacterium]